MRCVLVLACALGALACESSPKPPPPPSDVPPPDADYVCELRDSQGLSREPWEPRPVPDVRVDFVFSTEPPAGFPSELEERLGTGSIWSVRLPQDRRAWFWTEGPPGQMIRDAWYFAFVDTDGTVSLGPSPVTPWQGPYRMMPDQMATSSAGEIAIVASSNRPQPDTDVEALLIDADGVIVEPTRLPHQAHVHALQADAGDGFAMLIERRFDGPRSLTFARLTQQDGFEEQPEPIIESERFATGPVYVTPFSLISLDDGYLAAWEEIVPSGSRLKFRRLDARGAASGEERELLPSPEAPYQGQLTWVRYDRAIALLWVEGRKPYVEPSPSEISDWPHDDERYRFMLISMDDLAPRSEPLEIPKGAGLGDPRVLLQDGELLASAQFGSAAGTPSTPVAIDCRRALPP
jgi:hypothetical protein